MNMRVTPPEQNGPAHAVWAPSSAHRWIPCSASAPGIAALERVIEIEEGEEATEGTEAHDEIERCYKESAARTCDPLAVLDREHPAAYGIALFLKYVAGLPAGQLWIEQRVYLTDKIWGRCDLGHWQAEAFTLTIVDYKNGYVGVDPVECEQLRIYAGALIRQYNLPAKYIRYVVVQPNDFMPVPRVKQWSESAESLNQFLSGVVGIPDAPHTFAPTIGEHCRDCILFGMCPTSKDVLLQIGRMLDKPAQEVPVEQIATFSACKKPIEHWFTELWKHGTKLGLGGATIPGMKVVRTTTHRAWTNEAAARAAVLAAKGVDALKPPTPAQAEEMGIDVSKLAKAPEGGPALAFESDKRPTFERKSVEQMFKGVGT